MQLLLRRHRHEKRLVDALRQLRSDLGVAPSQHDGGERCADAAKVLVADDTACIVALLMLMQQTL
jgi:hypothetical protein